MKTNLFLRLLRFFLSILAGALIVVLLRFRPAPEWESLQVLKDGLVTLTISRLECRALNDNANLDPPDRLLSNLELGSEAKRRGEKGFWGAISEEFDTIWKMTEKIPFFGLWSIYEKNRSWKNIIMRVDAPFDNYEHGEYDPGFVADFRLLVERENEWGVTAKREAMAPIRSMAGKIIANTPTVLIETFGFARLVSMLLALLASAAKWMFRQRAKAGAIFRRMGASIFRLICPERGP